MKQLQLTDQEIQALINILDAGVKALGLSCVKNASYLLTKLENAEEVKEAVKKVKAVK